MHYERRRKHRFLYSLSSEAMYSGEYKWSLKSCLDEHKRSLAIAKTMKLRRTVTKQIKTSVGWFLGSRLIARMIRATIHSLRNSNYINKIPYMVSYMVFVVLQF